MFSYAALFPLFPLIYLTLIYIKQMTDLDAEALFDHIQYTLHVGMRKSAKLNLQGYERYKSAAFDIRHQTQSDLRAFGP